MAEKKLKKLSKLELVDIIYELQQQYDECVEENERLKAELKEREEKIASASSAAEAAIDFSQTLEKVCGQMLARAEEASARMLSDAEKKAQAIMDGVISGSEDEINEG